MTALSSSSLQKAILVAFIAYQADAFTSIPSQRYGLMPASSLTLAMSTADRNNDIMNIETIPTSRRGALTSFFYGVVASTTAAAAVTGVLTPNAAEAAEGSRVIGQISGSGLVFKVRLYFYHDIEACLCGVFLEMFLLEYWSMLLLCLYLSCCKIFLICLD